MVRLLALLLACCLIVMPGALATAQGGDGADRDAPLPMGDAIEIGDYEVTVVAVNRDAEAVILESSDFNVPAKPGNVFVMVTVSVTYIGSDSGDPGWDLYFYTVGDQNRGYDQYDFSCGEIPNGEFSAGELFEDGTVEYNLCWQVSEEEAPSLVMYVEETLSIDGARVWLSLDPDTAAPVATPSDDERSDLEALFATPEASPAP